MFDVQSCCMSCERAKTFLLFARFLPNTPRCVQVPNGLTAALSMPPRRQHFGLKTFLVSTNGICGVCRAPRVPAKLPAHTSYNGDIDVLLSAPTGEDQGSRGECVWTRVRVFFFPFSICWSRCLQQEQNKIHEIWKHSPKSLEVCTATYFCQLGAPVNFSAAYLVKRLTI